MEDDFKKKDKVLDEYAKMIQSLKREYQIVYTEKIKLKDFLRKQEEDSNREEQELLRKQHAKQMDIYSRMIAAHKKRQNVKGRRYYESDSNDYDAESIEDNHRGYEKRKKRPAKKINIVDYDDDDDVDNDYDDESEIEEKPKKRKKKKGVITQIKQ